MFLLEENVMYIVDGLLYRALVLGLLCLLIGVGLLIYSKFWNRKLLNKKELRISIFAIIFSILYISFFLYKAYRPNVAIHEGYLSREYRHFGMTYAYVFRNGSEKKSTFYMDSFSQKKIYNNDFSSEIKYKIYYEEDTKIILRIEEIDEPQ